MAVAFKTTLGTQVATASGTTLVITTTAAIAVGDLVVVRATSDNLSATTPTISCADSGGNTYTAHKFQGVNATAAAGIVGAILATKATAAISTGGTITVTFSGAIAARAAYAESFTGAENTMAVAAVSNSGASTTPSTSIFSVPLGALVCGSICGETRTAWTGDTDTLGGAWSTQVLLPNATSGTATNCVQIGGQWKVTNTGPTTQAFGYTITSTEWVVLIAAFTATPDPAITQAAYQFFDETGTESGATSLAAINTAVVGNLANGDGYGLVRLRLQATTAVAIPATDDFQLQWEINASGSWTNVGTGAVIGFNAPSLTEGQATTNRLGAGTGSFVAGKISEDGVVDDLGWTASNYTEVVYSVKLLAASFTKNDVLRFRVLRNGATTNMTYTQTPTVNITAPYNERDRPITIAATTTVTGKRASKELALTDAAYLKPSIARASTPDPGVLPTTGLVFVMKIRGPQITDTLNVCNQNQTDGQRSWRLNRSGSGGAFGLATYPDGTDGSAAWACVTSGTTIDTVNPEYFAVTFVKTSGAWGLLKSADGGTSYSTLGDGFEATFSNWFDSNDVVLIGADSGSSSIWDDKIYWVELRTGTNPVAGTLVWRFDASEYVSGTSFVDARSRTWTLGSAGAIVAATSTMTVTATATITCTDSMGVPPAASGGYLHHAAIAAPRNGLFTHTASPSSGTLVGGTLFTPTAGNLLVCVVEGGVTTFGSGGAGTPPDGWTLPANGDAVNFTGLYVFHKTAAGGDTMACTHNGSNYPVVFDFYEYAAGSMFVSCVKATGVGFTGINPNLPSLTGTNFVMGVKAVAMPTGAHSPSATWPSPNIEPTETFTAYSTTDGYWLSTAYQQGYTGSSYQPTCSLSVVGAVSCETLTFAVNAVAPVGAVTDNFNRANGAIGSGWSNSANWTIASGRANYVSTGSQYTTFLTDLGSPDHYIEVDLYVASFGVINIRRPSDGTTETGYLGFIHPTSGHAVIGRAISGSYGDVAESTTVYTSDVTPGIGAMTHRLRLEAIGSTINFYVDGALAVTATNTEITTGNYVGFNASDHNPLYDNFQAGAIAAPGVNYTVPYNARVVNNGSTIGSGDYTSGSFTTTAGTVLVACIRYVWNGPTNELSWGNIPTPVTSGLTWHRRAVGYREGNFGLSIDIWMADNASAGSKTIAQTGTHSQWDGSLLAVDVTILELTGAAAVASQQNGFAFGGRAYGGGTDPGAQSLTLPAAPESTSLVIAASADWIYSSTACTTAPGSGWTEVSDFANGISGITPMNSQVQVRAGSTSTDVSWADIQAGGSSDSFTWSLLACEFKQAGSTPMSQSVRFTASGNNFIRNAFGLAATDNITITYWMKLAVDRNDYSFNVDLGNGGSNYCQLGPAGNGTMLGRSVSTGGSHNTNYDIPVGKWIYFANSFPLSGGPSAVSMWLPDDWIDPAYTSGAMTSAWALSSLPLRIGCESFGGWFNGSIAAVKIWKAALSAAELIAEMTSSHPVRTADFYDWYSFKAGPQTISDAGSVRTLTQNGTPVLDTFGPPINVGTYTSPSGTNYNETGLPITIAATATMVDQVDYKSNVNLAVPVVVTATATDLRKLRELTTLAVPVVATATVLEQVDYKSNTLLAVPVVATFTIVDQVDYKSNLALAVPVVATATMGDKRGNKELALSTPATATVITGVDKRSNKELALLSDVVATVTCTDILVAPKTATLVDDFASTIDPVKWPDSSVAVVWDTGRAKIPVTTNYWSLQTNLTTGRAYDLTGSSIYAKVTPPPVGSGTRATIMTIFRNGANPQDNKLWMATNGSFLTLYTTLAGVETVVGGTGVPYDPVNHAWLAFFENAGSVYYSVSPNGIDWSDIDAVATPSWANKVAVGFTAGYYGAESAANAFIDNVNVPQGAQNYTETGLAIPIFATPAGVDQADWKSNTGLAIPVTATVTITEQVDYKSNLALPIPVVATAAAITQVDWKETPATVPVVADFTAPTQTFTHLGNFNETNLPVPIVATVTALDQVDYKSNTGLAVPVVATATATDKRKNLETALAVPIAATNTATSQADFKEAVPPLSVSVLAYVECTDLQQSPGHYDETSRDVFIVASVVTVVEQTDYRQLALAVSATATVAPTDLHKRYELAKAVAATATVASTSLLKRYEPGAVPVTATVAVADQADFKTFPALVIPVVADFTATDTTVRPPENLKVTMTASVTSTQRAFFSDPLSLPVAATVDGITVLHFVPLLLAASIIATIRGSDKKGSTLITVLGDADRLYLGPERVDRVYAGTVQVWP